MRTYGFLILSPVRPLILLWILATSQACMFLPSSLDSTAMELIVAKGMESIPSNEVVRVRRKEFYNRLTSTSVGAKEESEMLKRNANSDILSLDVGGRPDTGYYVSFLVGTPKTLFSLMIDTGSSNTGIVGYSDPLVGYYYQSTSYKDLHLSFTVSYTVGGWAGYRVQDVAYLTTHPTDNFTVTFDVITDNNNNFFVEGSRWQGILGMAYGSLVQPSPAPTFWDQLRETLKLKDSFSLKLCPPLDNLEQGTVLNAQRSYMDLGGYVEVDRVTIGGSRYTTPLDRTYPQMYYSVTITDIKVGNTTLPVDCKEFNTDLTIVDSGTTDIYFPVTVFSAIKAQMLGSIEEFGNLSLSDFDDFLEGRSKLAFNRYSLEYLYKHLPPLRIGLPHASDASRQFYLVIPSQLYLQETTGSIADKQSSCDACDFFYFAIKKRLKGTVIGSLALMGFYVNFDRENLQINFWLSTCEHLVYNAAVLPKIEEGPRRDPMVNCTCHNCPKDPAADWLLVTYILPGVAVVLLVVAMQAVHTRSWVKDMERLPQCQTVVCLWLKESMFCGFPWKLFKLIRFVGRKVHQRHHFTRLELSQEATLDESVSGDDDGYHDDWDVDGDIDGGQGTSEVIVDPVPVSSGSTQPEPSSEVSPWQSTDLSPRQLTELSPCQPTELSPQRPTSLLPQQPASDPRCLSELKTDHTPQPQTPTDLEVDYRAPIVTVQDTTGELVLQTSLEKTERSTFLVAIEEDLDGFVDNISVTEDLRLLCPSRNHLLKQPSGDSADSGCIADAITRERENLIGSDESYDHK